MAGQYHCNARSVVLRRQQYPPTLAIHGDPGPDPFQPVGPGEGRELRALIGIHDLGRAEAADRLVQRLDADLGLQRVRDAPGQHLAGEPVHDGDQIEKAPAHRDTGDVAAPDLTGPVDPQPAQGQVLRPFAGLLVSGFWQTGISRRMRFSFTAWPSFCKCAHICRTP